MIPVPSLFRFGRARLLAPLALSLVVLAACADAFDVVHIEHLRAAVYGFPVRLPLVFDAVDWLYRHLGAGSGLGWGLAYPQALGVWPACILLLAFCWTELVYPNAAVPADIAEALAGIGKGAATPIAAGTAAAIGATAGMSSTPAGRES